MQVDGLQLSMDLICSMDNLQSLENLPGLVGGSSANYFSLQALYVTDKAQEKGI